ncbi:MAG: type IV pilin protein [Acidiferrobacterales bacterium]
MKAKRVSNSGFTLIELMIVVVIIAILAGIAYPSYKNYTVKSKRSDAYAGLTQAATDQEKFYSQNMRFASSMQALNSLISGSSATTRMSPDGHYAITTTGGQNYTLTATAQGAQAAADTKCPTITLNSAGAKGPSASCW